MTSSRTTLNGPHSSETIDTPTTIWDNVRMEICPLTSTHAPFAAQLHIAGQPGTFLTSLGPEVLTVLYQTLPQSPVGFGFVALPETVEGQSAAPLGFVSATTSIGSLLVEMGTRRILQLLPPLIRSFAQRPHLALRSIQTVLYPFLSQNNETATNVKGAELLSIMVDPDARNQGIGEQLLYALLRECRARNLVLVDVTVDATNAGAQRFYSRYGFAQYHNFHLYGRAMQGLRLDVRGVNTTVKVRR